MFPEFLHPVRDLLVGHPYAFIFIGLLIAGELVLLPAIYLSVTGRLHPGYVFAIAVLATATSDLFWYFLGRRLPREHLERIGSGRIGRAMAGMERLFLRRGPQILVGSKFVYGSRTAVQVLSGVHRVGLRTYALANSAGVLLLVAALFAIGYTVRGTVGRMGELVDRLGIAFLAFIVLAVLVNLLASRMLRQRWSR
jgi:membrane protein DedA with SNARE-associated domain